MIPDSQTNFLYLADTLKTMPKYADFYTRFENLLVENTIPHDYLSGTKDIWARDYMPVQISKDKLVKFDYDPSYLKFKKYEKLKSDQGLILSMNHLQADTSNIKLDGGNVVKSAHKVIMTDRIFSENMGIKEKELMDRLYEELEVNQIILIPADPTDFTGHADGMVRFINDNTVFINTYPAKDAKLERALKNGLNNARLNWVEMPYSPNEHSAKDAKGIYMNYLQIEDVIFVPKFEHPDYLANNEEAISILKETFIGSTIIPVESTEIAAEGGILNCISWNVLKE